MKYFVITEEGKKYIRDKIIPTFSNKEQEEIQQIAKELAEKLQVMSCPECGMRENETVNGMFSGPEPAIRLGFEGTAECVKCGFVGLIPSARAQRG